MSQSLQSDAATAEKWERARSVVPRGVSSGHRVGWEQVFVKASGAYIWDDQGNKYIDYINSWGPIVLGHCDARVNEAVFKAASTCDLTGVGPQVGEYELAEKITSLVPSADKVAFCTSGTDATMHAAHIVRAATGRVKILKFHGSYHGWSDVLAVGSSRTDLTTTSPLATPNSAGLHPGATGDVVVVEWNDFEGYVPRSTSTAQNWPRHSQRAIFTALGACPPSQGSLSCCGNCAPRMGRPSCSTRSRLVSARLWVAISQSRACCQI